MHPRNVPASPRERKPDFETHVSLGNLEPHWAVIAAHHLGGNPSAFQRGAEFLRRHEVVDAPSDVSRAAVHHLAPPRIMSRAFLEFAERVDITARQNLRKILP